MIHSKKSPLAGRAVRLKIAAAGPSGLAPQDGDEFQVEDWWDRVAGRSWMDATGNPAALNYAARGGLARPPLPMDNEVLYGKVGALGYLVHLSEVASESPTPAPK